MSETEMDTEMENEKEKLEIQSNTQETEGNCDDCSKDATDFEGVCGSVSAECDCNLESESATAATNNGNQQDQPEDHDHEEDHEHEQGNAGNADAGAGPPQSLEEVEGEKDEDGESEGPSQILSDSYVSDSDEEYVTPHSPGTMGRLLQHIYAGGEIQDFDFSSSSNDGNRLGGEFWHPAFGQTELRVRRLLYFATR